MADTPATSEPQVPTNPVTEILTGDAPLADWLVPDFIARGSILVWAGEAGGGKSFACYVMAIACATGTPFLGFTPTRPLRVLYFDEENARADRDQYLRWAWKGLGCPSLELITSNFWTEHFTLGSSTWARTAEAAILERRPDLIYVDTATPAFNIEDEDDNGEATTAIKLLRRLQSLASPRPAIIVLKHARIIEGEDGDKRYTVRGAKAWVGGVDGLLFHIKAAGRPRRDHLKNTNLHPDKVRAFGLREIVKIHPHWLGDKEGLILTRRTEVETPPDPEPPQIPVNIRGVEST